jgi:hypothetical protein
MKVLLTLCLCIALSTPALGGPPADGTYTSIDIGGTMLAGRYSESWYPTRLSVNNTLNEQSWNGSTLATQWHWYCPWIVSAPALLSNTVDGNGNGNKIWQVTYSGGFCWLDGAGPWAGGDASYTATINSWTAIVTETYANHVEVGTVRSQNANSTFNGYSTDCMALEVHNNEKLGDTSGGPLPAGFPSFWNWNGCFDQGPAGPGEWGDVDSITMTIFNCTVLSTQEKTWGSVKAMYR